MSSLKLLSWNVNGIRACIRKGFLDFLKNQNPDILALQEIKISQAAIHEAKFDFPMFTEYWNPATRPGYSGTAFLVRENLKVKYLEKLDWDTEGRIQVLDIGKYYLANIYFPNANHELSRLDFKLKFNDRLLKYLKSLEKKKPLIITGDYNVAHNEIDLARPKDNIGNAGFTEAERDWMTRFLKSGFKDTFRELHPQKVQYSWWTFRANARQRNIGWRIDYFCVSGKIMKHIDKAFILDNIQGSDHAPVGIDIKI